MLPLRLLIPVVLALGLALSGCTTGSTSDSGEATQASTKAEADAYPVTVRHAFGSTTIEKEPTRVATLGWSDQDTAVSLGVVPVGAVKITYGGNAGGSTDFFDAAVKRLGGQAPTRYSDKDGIPFADVAKVRPDLILATNSGLTKKDYVKLSRIAPVVAYAEAGKPFLTPWRTQLEMVGKALGRSEQATRVEDKAQSQIDAAKKEYPALAGKSLIVGYLSKSDLSTVGIYGSEDTRVAFLRDLGLTDAPAVAATVKPGQFYGTVSAEKASELTSDVLFAFTDEGADLSTFAKNPLLSKLPAIADRHALIMSDTTIGEAITNPTPLSIPFVLEDFVPRLDAAAARS